MLLINFPSQMITSEISKNGSAKTFQIVKAFWSFSKIQESDHFTYPKGTWYKSFQKCASMHARLLVSTLAVNHEPNQHQTVCPPCKFYRSYTLLGVAECQVGKKGVARIQAAKLVVCSENDVIRPRNSKKGRSRLKLKIMLS